MAVHEPVDETNWVSVVGRLSLALGILYIVGYTAYVITGWDVAVYLPPILYLGFLLWQSAISDLWYCDRCAESVASKRCPDCGSALLDSESALKLLTLYVVMVPAGTIVVEVLLLLGQAAVFTAFRFFPPVVWYQRQWLDVVSFVGPVPFLAYTLATVAVAALVASGFRTLRAGATSVLADLR